MNPVFIASVQTRRIVLNTPTDIYNRAGLVKTSNIIFAFIYHRNIVLLVTYVSFYIRQIC